MKQLVLRLAVVAILVASCGGDAAPASCAEYAADLRQKAETLTAEEMSNYIDDTAEQVARLLQSDPADGEVCATAVLEALFSTGLSDSFSGFQD